MARPKKDPELELQKLIARTKFSPASYAKIAYQWGEGELASSKGLRKWQRDVMLDIEGHILNPVTRFTPLKIAVSSGHGVGKAHPVTMQLYTPSGLKIWGELRAGDKVFDENGESVKIISTNAYEDIDIYRVTFHDGSSCDVSSGHLWNIRGRQERRNKEEGWRTLSTQDIIQLGVKRSNGVVKARQWEIPIQGATKFKKRKVLLHPYLVGVWLGDGGRKTPRFTSNDEEVINKVREFGYSIHIGGKQKTNTKSVYVHNIKDKLNKLGVLDKYSYQKSVPICYLENDCETRSEVLRGLLDADGEVNTQGTTIFSSTSNALAKDVIWLARSLGGKAQMQPTVKKPFFNDSNGNKKAGLDCYRVTIQMPSGFRSFYIERKQSRIGDIEHRYLNRWIDNIEYVGKSDAMCITVDSKSGLYQANDFIVTHNSTLVSMIVDWAMSTCVDCKVIVTANTRAQLEGKTMPEIAKWTRACVNTHWFTTTATSVSSSEKGRETTWKCKAETWSENNTEAFAGLHNEGKRIVLIFDEASAIADKVWEVAEGAMTDANTEIIWLAFGNPTRNTGRFRECFGRYKHRWKTYHVDSRTVEGTNKEQIGEWVKDYGEDSDFVRVRVKGEFPKAASMQFIASDMVEEARRRSPEAWPDDVRVMGVDVARFGDDQSVIVRRVGRDCSSHPLIKLRGVDTMTLAARIVDEAERFKPDVIFVDGGGVGGGVIDRLNMLRKPVVEVQFGSKADRSLATGEGTVVYANKRAEMWGYMREWLRGGSIPDDPALGAQLIGVEYGYVMKEGRDAILLEKKADMKKRGLDSPDEADAIAITFAYPVMKSSHTEDLRGGHQHADEYASYNPYSRASMRGLKR